PTEITSQILVHSLPKYRYLYPSSKLAPLLLTRICRRWKDVAVGLPSLWCRLYLDVNEVHGRLAADSFCYDSWLRRSQGLPPIGISVLHR
ncbi:uncharacterized protein BJ212DRAFT_1271589, partial [Suillus subaureus]